MRNNKIKQISKNKDILQELIKQELIQRYYFREGVYLNNIKNDEVIDEATKLLSNTAKYREILSLKK